MRLFLYCIAMFFLLACHSVPTVEKPAEARKLEVDEIRHLDEILHQADSAYQKDTRKDVERAETLLLEAISINSRSDHGYWQLARCHYWFYEHSEDKKQKDIHARKGIEYAKKGIFSNADSGPSHYFYAISLGIFAKLHPLSAMNQVKEIIKAGKKAVALEPAFDHAGPHRLLGYTYLRAPETMGGDIDLALEHFQEANKLAPKYAGNLLGLAQVYAEDGEDEEAQKLVEKILDSGEKFQDRVSQLQKTREEARQLLDGME